MKNGLRKKGVFYKNKILLFMCLPSIIFFFIFAYLPLPGLYLAFVDYNYSQGMFGSQFVGLNNFKFLTLSGDLWMLVKNTVLYNFAFIITSNVVQIIMALMLNEIRNKYFRKVTQSVMILPHFISYVIVGLFAYNILNFDYGILNTVRESMGMEKAMIYSNPNIWPAILIFVNLWKGVGYGTIVYFSAIMGIDLAIMEAASIDGANAYQRIRYVMMPCLKPTLIIMLLFALGGILRGNFQMFYNLIGGNNKMLFESTDIIETYVYRAMMNNFNFSTASAVSLFQSVFGFIIVIGANRLVKKVEPDYSLF